MPRIQVGQKVSPKITKLYGITSWTDIYRVFLDGEMVHHCVEFDTDKNYVVKYIMKGTEVVLDSDHSPAKEKLFGKVTYTIKEPA